MTDPSCLLTDPVGDVPGAREIAFDKSRHANAADLLFANLERNPDAVAVTGPGGEVSYRALCEDALRWGGALAAAGCRKGERIALFLDDTPCLPAIFFGAMRAGFVPVLLNILTSPDLLNHCLGDMAARIAVCDAAFADRFTAAAVAGTAFEILVVVNGEPAAEVAAAVPAARFLGSGPTRDVRARTGPDDMAFWMYSSGSTGRPKGIVHLHHDMAYTAESYGRHVLRLRDDDICFSVPKIFFAYGLGNSLTFPFAVGATSVLVAGQPRPEAIFSAIAAYRPTVFFGLPTLYTALARSPAAAGADLSSLRLSVSAAETLSAEITAQWERLCGHGPVEGLGSTEMLHIYLSNTVDTRKPGSAGRRVPGYEVALHDADGSPVRAGSEGVMWVRGHSSTPCYWNRPQDTAETMRGDWIRTGDRFVEDEDGFFFFKGRADDLVKVSGQWVYPLEVERCLAEHPAIHECAVLAHELPDRRMTLRAFVCLKDPGQAGPATTAALQTFVKHALLPYKYPRIVDYLPELPKTGTGKIDRQALAKLDRQADRR